MDKLTAIAIVWASGIGLTALVYLVKRLHAWWNGEDYPFENFDPGDGVVVIFWPVMLALALAVLFLYGISYPVRAIRDKHVESLREKKRLASLRRTDS